MEINPLLTGIKNNTIKPDFVDSCGNQFWIHDTITKAARYKGLKNVVGAYVKHHDDNITMVLIENNEVIHESTSLEVIDAKLCMIAIERKFK